MARLLEKSFRSVVLVVALVTVLCLVFAYHQPIITLSTSNAPGQQNVSLDDITKTMAQLSGLRGAQQSDQSHTSRVLCMIFTTPANWATRARAVKNTWARRCYRAVFFYSRGDQELPGAVALNVTEGRGFLTDKTRAALQWSLDNYDDQVDWYLKADDDAYFYMENLEAFLTRFSPEVPHYVGKNNARELKSGYASGGAGYILNTRAVQLLLNGTNSHPAQCKAHGGIEDRDVGDCLRAMDVFQEETRDDRQRQRFHCNDPAKVLRENIGTYYITKGDYVYGSPQDINWMLSPELISFHYVSPETMYVYDYLLYDVRAIPAS